MRVLATSAAAAALMLVAACGSSDDGTGAASAEDAVARLLTALEDGNCADAKDVVVTPDLVDCEMIESLRGGYAADGIDLDEARMSTGEVVDGSSVVTVDVGDEAAQTWQVERVDGSWKVLFDSEE